MLTNIQTGVEPQDIVFANTFLWIAHANGDIHVLDRDGNRITMVTAAGGITGLATNGERIWAAHRRGEVTQIDAASGEISARWTLPCTTCLIRGIHWDGTALWVSNFGETTLTRIDANSGSMHTVPAEADSPTTIISDRLGLLVLHQSLGTQGIALTRHDLATGALLAALNESTFPTAFASDGIHLWAALRDTESGVLVQYDAVTLAEQWRVDAPAINDLLLAAGSLWSADFTNNTLSKWNPATGDVLDVYDADALPQSLAFDGTYIWVVNRRANNLTRIWAGEQAAN